MQLDDGKMGVSTLAEGFPSVDEPGPIAGPFSPTPFAHTCATAKAASVGRYGWIADAKGGKITARSFVPTPTQ